MYFCSRQALYSQLLVPAELLLFTHAQAPAARWGGRPAA